MKDRLSAVRCPGLAISEAIDDCVRIPIDAVRQLENSIALRGEPP